MANRILIADDNPTILDYLEIVFSRQGFAVTKAGHGEQALASAQNLPPDLILLDVMMPGLDGLEVTRRLRSDPRTARIPILLYSAVVGEETRAQATAAGADEFLGKNVNHNELVTKVREWIASRSTPGGVGAPSLVEVGLDLALLLESEWVWLVGAQAGKVCHLALCCERGEQQAIELLQVLGPGPYPMENGSFWGEVLVRGEWMVNVPFEKLARAPGAERIAEAVRRAGGLAVTILPLIGPQSERGALVYAPPPTVGQTARSAQVASAAARYASAAISLWGDLPKLPRPAVGAARQLPFG